MVEVILDWQKSKAEDLIGNGRPWHFTAVFLCSAKGQLEQLPLTS